MSQLSPLAVALASVDPANDAHWTTDGSVRVEVVNKALDRLEAGIVVNRQDIIDHAPTFTRESAPDYIAAIAAMRDRASSALEKTTPMVPSSPQPAAAAQAPQVAAPAPKASALQVPIPQLIASPDLLRQAIAELDEKNQELLAQRKKIDAELEIVAQRAEFCSRALVRIEPREDPASGIKAYLDQQAAVREGRIKRTRSFVDAGVNAKDIAAELIGSSRLDSAMGRRRGGFGSQRPTARVPPQVAAAATSTASSAGSAPAGKVA